MSEIIKTDAEAFEMALLTPGTLDDGLDIPAELRRVADEIETSTEESEVEYVQTDADLN